MLLISLVKHLQGTWSDKLINIFFFIPEAAHFLHISKKRHYQVLHKNAVTINKDNDYEDGKKDIFNTYRKLKTQRYSDTAQICDLFKVLVPTLITGLFNKHYICLGLKKGGTACPYLSMTAGDEDGGM